MERAAYILGYIRPVLNMFYDVASIIIAVMLRCHGFHWKSFFAKIDYGELVVNLHIFQVDIFKVQIYTYIKKANQTHLRGTLYLEWQSQRWILRLEDNYDHQKLPTYVITCPCFDSNCALNKPQMKLWYIWFLISMQWQHIEKKGI